MYRKILIPIHTEESVDRVVKELKTLRAALTNSSITLLYVQTLVYNTTLGLEAVVVTPDVEREGLFILQQARQLLERMKLSCRTVLKTGDPVQEISKYAAEELIDLIVICRREQGLLERLLLTNISDELVERVSTNLLVLK